MSERARLSSPDDNASSREPERVREMFGRISSRYDFANHVLSAGCDFFWRNRAAEIVRQWNAPCVLDLAAGSGDLALALHRKMPRAQIFAADFSAEMLALARRKGVRNIVVADALRLPFADQSFDAVTIAFGLRNMRDWRLAISEMRRVLTSRGRVLVLDFSLPPARALRAGYRFYLHRIIPHLCALITRDRAAYEYLGASIENFPSGRDMCDLIESSGFREAKAQRLSGGIVTIYTASCSGGL